MSANTNSAGLTVRIAPRSNRLSEYKLIALEMDSTLINIE